MLTRWYPSMKRTGLISLTPSNSIMGNDNTSSHGETVTLSAEPEEADVGDAQYPAKMHPNVQHPTKDAERVPKHDGSAILGSGRSDSAFSESTLIDPSHHALVDEKASYKSMCSDANNRTGRHPAVAGGEGRENISDSTFPHGHSADDGAIPVYLGQKPKNVILFGETGVGKSSVINLMAGKEIAKISANLKGCTLEAKEHWFALSEDVPVRIFDTVGLEEPEMGVNSFMGAIEKAHKLVTSLHHSGGIDLLLFCIRGGRITTAMQRSYRLFYEILCGSQVPLAIVVTNLEQEDVMENWWVDNEETFQEYGIHPVAHACITAVPAHVQMYARKRAESQKALRNMLLDTLTKPNPPYVRSIRSWFAAIIQLLRSYLGKRESLRKKDLMRKLEKRCMLTRDDAEKLAQMLAGGEMIDAALVQQVWAGV